MMRISVFACAAAVLLSVSGVALAAPSRPSDDSLVLATVPPPRAALRALMNSRHDLAAALAVARDAITEGRNQADPRFYGEAQAALAPWWSDAEAPQDVRMLRAMILQAYHQFAAASADLDAIIAASPENPQARLSRAFIRLTTGDYAGAAKDCRHLAAAGPTLAAICRSRHAALTGSGRKGFDDLAQAATTDRRGGLAMRRFAIAVLADIAVSLGEDQKAEKLFRLAMADDHPDAALVAAYGDWLIAAWRPQEALAALDGKGESDILLLRRAIAAKMANDPRLADWAGVLGERFAAARASGNRVHLREEARYLLEIRGDATGALALAVENWTVQKEPADAQILLAAALAAGQPGAAAPVSDFLARTGLQDQRIAPLLAEIAQAAQ